MTEAREKARQAIANIPNPVIRQINDTASEGNKKFYSNDPHIWERMRHKKRGRKRFPPFRR